MSSISRRQFLGFGVMGAAALALAACSNKNDSQASSSTSTSSAATAAPTDANSQRVVALGAGQTADLLELGILPVGIALPDGETTVPQYLRDAYGSKFDLDSIKLVGSRTAPDFVAISDLKPTRIYAAADTDPQLLSSLRAITAVTTTDNVPANWRDNLLTIAEAVGKKTEAQKKIDLYSSDVQAISKKLSSPAPTVSFLQSLNPIFALAGASSMPGLVAADCGLARPDNQNFTDAPTHPLQPADMIQADAQWLYYGVAAGSVSPTTDPTWTSLGAVHNNQAVAVDFDLWFIEPSLLAANSILGTFKEGPAK
ncbi:MAG: ABC transporter substrate-binding protein [Corynebacterium sp.]|nr:ABC transporter substrate-binding protein [Corynebacterium sp.]